MNRGCFIALLLSLTVAGCAPRGDTDGDVPRYGWRPPSDRRIERIARDACADEAHLRRLLIEDMGETSRGDFGLWYTKMKLTGRYEKKTKRALCTYDEFKRRATIR